MLEHHARKIRTRYPAPNYNAVPSETTYGATEIRIVNPDLELLGPLGPIPYTSECSRLGYRIRKADLTPSEYIEFASKLIQENKSLLNRWSCLVLLRLHLYASKFEDGIMENPIEYLVHSLIYGPRYSKYLKDLRANMFQFKLGTYNSRHFFEKYEKLREMKLLPSPVKGGTSYDKILNERYLIHYEDTTNDFFDYPFRKIDKDDLFVEQFELMVDKFFSEISYPIFSPTKEDMKNWITDSTSADDQMSSSVNRTLMRKLVSNDIQSLERPDSRFLRTVINVGPANVRDAWQCDIPTLFKVKKVSFIMRQIVSHHNYSAMTTEAKARRRRKKLRSDSFFVMTDIKKCGLSIPRYLLKIIADKLDQWGFPGGPELKSLAEGPVYFEGKPYFPERGTGLGNANEVITLIQCIICDVARELGEADDGIFFNDDGVYRVSSGRVSLPKLISLYQKYGIIMNTEKSYYSRYNIFCEDYEASEYDFSKAHLRCLSIATLFEQSFIHDQKKVFDSLIKDLDIFSEGKIRKSFRYEFHKFESILPISLGGWKNTSKGGINILLDYITRPQEYLDVESRSFIPLMNKWITFLLSNKEEFFEIFYQQKRFPYRRKVSNPFNEDYQDLNLYDLDGLDPIITKNRYPQFEKLYNERGIKNAKPKIRKHFGIYSRNERQRFFRRFWKEKENIHSCVKKDMVFLMSFLTFLRGEENLCRNLAPPSFIGKGRKLPLFLASKTKKVIYSRAKCIEHDDEERRVNTLLAFRDGSAKPNMSIRNLTFLFESRGESYFTSSQGVHELEFDVPTYYSLFFRDKQYFSSVFFNLYGFIPESWLYHDSSFLDLDYLRSSIFGILFGEEAQNLSESINTFRERSVFNYITKDKIIDSIEKLRIAICITKKMCGDLRIRENCFLYPNRIQVLELDMDIVNEIYPELAIDFLVEDNLFGEDYEEFYSEDELIPDSRLDMIDVLSGLDF